MIKSKMKIPSELVLRKIVSPKYISSSISSKEQKLLDTIEQEGGGHGDIRFYKFLVGGHHIFAFIEAIDLSTGSE